MGYCLVLPVGVTPSIVQRVVREAAWEGLDCVVAVTVESIMGAKEDVVEVARREAESVGARFHFYPVDPWEPETLGEAYRVMLGHGGPFMLSGVTGSRMLLPLLSSMLFRLSTVWGRETRIYQGVEGERYGVEPLQGYLYAGLPLPERQEAALRLVYSGRAGSPQELARLLGVGRSVYKVIGALAEKGLVSRSRGSLEPTLPGRLLYAMLRVEEGEAGRV